MGSKGKISRHIWDFVNLQWHLYPGHTTVMIMDEIKTCIGDVQDDRNVRYSPDSFPERIIFMSMFNYVEWWIQKNEMNCRRNATEVIRICSSILIRILVLVWNGRRCFLEIQRKCRPIKRRIGRPCKPNSELLSESSHSIFKRTHHTTEHTRKWKDQYTMGTTNCCWDCAAQSINCCLTKVDTARDISRRKSRRRARKEIGLSRQETHMLLRPIDISSNNC